MKVTEASKTCPVRCEVDKDEKAQAPVVELLWRLEDISFMTNKTDGETIKMRRDRKVWVIDAYIEEDIDQGFTRPEQAP